MSGLDAPTGQAPPGEDHCAGREVADLRTATARGTLWAAADQVLRQSGTVLVSIVLARLLAPEQFGLMAMAVVFTAFAALIGQLGLEAAVVRSASLPRRTLTGMFWLSLVANVALGGLLAALSPLIAALYREPGLAAVLCGIAATFPLQALATVPRGLLVRDLSFRRIFGADLVAVTSGAAVTVAVAAARPTVWALVIGLGVQAAVGSTSLMAASRWRPGLRFGRDDLRGRLAFSGFLLAFDAVNYWARNVDNLLVGRFLGATALGFYERAYLMFLYPVSQITATLGRVMLSSLSRMGEDLARIRSAYLRSLAAIALVSAPIMFGLCVLAEPFVLVVFGRRWTPVVPVLQILAAFGPVQAVASSVGYLYQARGRTDLQFRVGLRNAVVIVAAIAAGVATGSLVGVALVYGIVATLVLLHPTMAPPTRLIGLPLRAVAAAVAPSFACAAGMAGAVALLDRLVLADAAAALRLGCGTALGVLVYAGLVLGLRLRAWRDVRAAMAGALRRGAGAA